jgi:hypothetical protein
MTETSEQITSEFSRKTIEGLVDSDYATYGNLTYSTPRDEMSVSTSRKGKTLGLALTNIQSEPSAFPHFVLSMINVERRVSSDAEKHVAFADDELAPAKAHRQAAVATPAGLEKHDGPATVHQFSNSLKCRLSYVDTRWL